MECFFTVNGAEEKAKLEDILSLIDDWGIQLIFMDALGDPDIAVHFALVHIAGEIKEKVCRNLPTRVRHRIEKEVKSRESYCLKDDYFTENAREGLISFIGEKHRRWFSDSPERLVWKEKVYKIAEQGSPEYIEELTKKINKASNSGVLSIDVNDLPAAAGLFEKGGIKELSIHGKFNGIWPDFLNNCRTLTYLYLNINKLTELPSWIRNAVSLRFLLIWWTDITLLPDWIGDLKSLTELSIHYYYNKKIEKLPDSIGNLSNLTKLDIINSDIEKLPDSIGNLSSLETLTLYNNRRLTSLPDSIGNLKNLTVLNLSSSSILTLPGGIGGLEKLTELSLNAIFRLKHLPDSIGKLKNLKTLAVSSTDIVKLPDFLSNCTSLECVDIRYTSIRSIPDFLSSIRNIKQSIEIMPINNVHSYNSFCDAYNTLTVNLIQFAIKSQEEGLLALEDDLEDIPDIFFREGLKLVVCGTDVEIIKRILTHKLERERNHYRKRLKLMVMEGILCIQRGDSISRTGIKLGSMVNIKNNPLDAALAKYLSGDYDAFDYVNLRARPPLLKILTRLNKPVKMKRPKNRDVIRFIKRADEIRKIYFKEGLLALEKHLDNDGIMARDVFEYGLCLMVECWNKKEIDKVLTMFIDDEKDPVCKNFALAKRESFRMISEGETTAAFESALLAYFDDEVTKDYLSEMGVFY